MVETFCGVLSQRTGTIAILSFPVLSFLQLYIVGLYLNLGYLYEPEVRKIEFFAIILVCFCIVGLIGVEQKKPSFLVPVLWTISVVIVFIIAAQIAYIFDYFQFKKSKNCFAALFNYSLILESMLLYSGIIIHGHFLELRVHKPTQIDV